MNRRAFVTGLGAVLAAPVAAGAQPAGKAYQVALLSNAVDPAAWRVLYKPFIDAMRDLNYVEGRNLVFKPAFADGHADRLSALATDLVKAKVDVIVASAPTEVAAAKQATLAIPIVMWLVPDPVGSGLVGSLAHPGGNVTGLTSLVPGLTQKYVELLRDALPLAQRFAIVGSSPTATLRQVEAAARSLGLTLSAAKVSGPEDFGAVLAQLKKAGVAGIIVALDGVTFLHRALFVQQALKHRLPGIYWAPEYVEAGGLMTYSANTDELRRRAATYVDKILKGAKPADLPVEQPTKFELVINLKTAKALGLTIPPSLLLRADQVID
jgi:putative tryptophan/tyrosine transport system substrate-binding protein